MSCIFSILDANEKVLPWKNKIEAYSNMTSNAKHIFPVPRSFQSSCPCPVYQNKLLGLQRMHASRHYRERRREERMPSKESSNMPIKSAATSAGTACYTRSTHRRLYNRVGSSHCGSKPTWTSIQGARRRGKVGPGYIWGQRPKILSWLVWGYFHTNKTFALRLYWQRHWQLPSALVVHPSRAHTRRLHSFCEGVLSLWYTMEAYSSTLCRSSFSRIWVVHDDLRKILHPLRFLVKQYWRELPGLVHGWFARPWYCVIFVGQAGDISKRLVRFCSLLPTRYCCSSSISRLYQWNLQQWRHSSLTSLYNFVSNLVSGEKVLQPENVLMFCNQIIMKRSKVGSK